jgi:hypothetical protein
MRNFYLFCLLFCLAFPIFAQTPKPSPTPTPTPRPTVQTNQNVFDLSEYGVQIQPDSRLIVVMAALEVAGFDPTPGQKPSLFRQRLQENLKDLDPELRRRLQEFYTRNNKNLVKATPGEQAARYVSLAYSLTPVPELMEPARTDDLPGSLLEILDFAPLVREFYRKSRIEANLPEYVRSYQAIGDSWRQPTAVMVRDLLAYMRTRPQLTYMEKVKVATGDKKKKLEKTELREHTRRFLIVPDLLGVPGTVKLRVIGDDYFAVVTDGVDLSSSSELRRAYLQFIIDPLINNNAKEIAVHREAIKSLLAEREQAGKTVSPDIFLAVARSLVVAADAREEEFYKTDRATALARQRIDQLKNADDKKALAESLKKFREQAEHETFLDLAEGYDSGAVLSFFFADQLRGLENSGFDIASSLTDMIISFDINKEKARLTANAEQRKQALAELAERRKKANETVVVVETPKNPKEAKLVAGLREADELIRLRDLEKAEARLKELLLEYNGEPRIFYYLGRVASLTAVDAIDESVRDERLNKALTNYRNVIVSSASDTDPALRSLSYVAIAKIFEFREDNSSALQAYEQAIKIGNVKGGAYQEALAGKQRLSPK